MRKLFNIDLSEISLVSAAACLNDEGNSQEFMIVKNDDKPKWDNVNRMLYGFCQSDLELLDDQVIDVLEPIEKMSKDNPFPSISRQINLQKQGLENFLSELED